MTNTSDITEATNVFQLLGLEPGNVLPPPPKHVVPPRREDTPPLPAPGTSHPEWEISLTLDGRVFKSDGKQMKGSLDKDGYLRFFVRRGNVVRRKPIHTLMLETFVGPRPSRRHQGRHLDDDKSNNVLSNLAWGTPKQNCKDRSRNGKTAAGERHYRAKLTASQVEQIRIRAVRGNYQALGREFGVSGVLVGLIAKGRVWKNAN